MNGDSLMNRSDLSQAPSFAARDRSVPWAAVVGCSFFFVLLYLPVSRNELKGILIGIVFSSIVIGILLRGGRLGLHKTVFLGTLFYAAIGTWFVLWGTVHNASGALFSSLIYVIWPLVYIMFVSAVANYGILLSLLRTMVIATLAIGLSALNYVLWAKGWLPNWLLLPLDLGLGFYVHEGYIEMSFYAISSLIFLVPFLMAALTVYTKRTLPFVSRRLLWAALVLGFSVVLLSGRRALQIVVAFAPFIILLLRAFLPTPVRIATRRSLSRTILVGAFLVLAIFLAFQFAFGLRLTGIYRFIESGFLTQQDSGATVRSEQLSALLKGWAKKPLLGAGLGASVEGSVRSTNRPWNYELQYALLLYQTGIIGVLLYGLGIAWIYWMALRIIRSGTRMGTHMIPVLTGTTCFLIANASNPYLQAYGNLWTIFLPIAMINIWLFTQNKKGPWAHRIQVEAL